MLSTKINKGFISLFVIFFISLFLLTTMLDKPVKNSEFTIIKLTDTKKQNNILNIEQIIKNELNNSEDDSYKVQSRVNKKLIEYFNKDKIKSYYIYNKVNNKKEKISFLGLQGISRSIVYRPDKHILVKKYIITNGILKDKKFMFEINLKNYKTNFYFPENYEVKLVVPV